MEKNPLRGFLTLLMMSVFMAFSLGSYAQTAVTGTVTGEDGSVLKSGGFDILSKYFSYPKKKIFNVTYSS